ncbi:MAG: exodeoxyribonuclease VII small subunit [Clostridia bacterium]|nr:exodeoxyribonuclease VII small subunit [Clostridia bacterium]
MAAKKEKDRNLTIEEAFSEIDTRIKALEADDISLEDSFREYREGMELLKYCHEAISEVEKKVQKIAEDGTLEDFD